jgi:hypothetical protein
MTGSRRNATRAALALLVSGALLASVELGAISFTKTQREWLSKPPFYKTFAKKQLPAPGTRVGWFPVSPDNRMFLGLGRQNAVLRPLLEAMSAHLAAQDWAVPLPAIERKLDDAPDVFLGNGEMAEARFFLEAGEDERRQMLLGVETPTKEWKAELQQRLDAAQVGHALYMMVGVSEYFVRQKGWTFKKEIRLGTGYSVPLSWLTTPEAPLYVLQLTGVLLDRDGRPLRAGAEGIYAKTGPLVLTVLDVPLPISPEDVRNVLLTERREGLPGQPLSWQAALQNLVAQLLGRSELLLE